MGLMTLLLLLVSPLGALESGPTLVCEQLAVDKGGCWAGAEVVWSVGLPPVLEGVLDEDSRQADFEGCHS